MAEPSQEQQTIKYPRVAITYCTQCKWMLRAAYFGQELLSTFGTSIGEIALIPSTGGTFTVYLTYQPPGYDVSGGAPGEQVLIWDRKTDGGFPEAKILKQRIRNHIEPDKNLGHSDTPSAKGGSVGAGGEFGVNRSNPANTAESVPTVGERPRKDCDDCA